MVGRSISHYEILDKLGEGGMAVVYRARDTRLGRMVAVKILPAEALAKPDRKLRFIQEARTASALNHPNIVTVYDIDACDGTDFIAMEYIPGKTLGAWIGRKGLKIGDVLKLSAQIADAIATALAAGVIHRDLKPSNVMVTENGVAKVLDFGLAKLSERSSGDLGAGETETMENKPKTEEGFIVGTVAYMSPEQAEGKVVDARSDIFSFGTLLYEMVTGRRPFQRDSKLSTLSAILKEQPAAASGIKPELPHDLETIINRCLRKDPNRRFQHMADVKIALEELKEMSDSGTLPLTGQAGPRKRSLHSARAAGLAAMLLLAVIVTWMRFFRPQAPAAGMLTAVPLTTYRGSIASPAFSPDGNQVAFSWAGEKEDNDDIYVKLIGPGPPIRLTTDPAGDFSPAWSPDGRWIVFGRRVNQTKWALYLIPALGGPERKLLECYVHLKDLEVPGPHLSWSNDSTWIIGPLRDSPSVPAELSLISRETGEHRRLIPPEPDSLGDTMPALSPDGRTLAYCRATRSQTCDIYLARLTPDLRLAGNPIRLTSENHYIVGLDFTADGREIIFSSARAGKFALWRIPVSGGTPRPVALIGEDAFDPKVSRRGGRLVYVRATDALAIWRVPLSHVANRVGQASPFLFSSRDEQTPQFSPDGRRVAFSSDRSGSWEIWLANADGSGAVQMTTFGPDHEVAYPTWSPGSDRVAFRVLTPNGSRWEIYWMSVSGGQPQRLTNGWRPFWSRDGHWIYFVSDLSGSIQIWKISPAGGQPVQVTKKGGAWPVESPDGKFVYFGRDETCVSVWRISAARGEEEHVLDVPGELWSSFALAGDGIYYLTGKNVEFFQPASGARKHIAAIEKPVQEQRLSVSPDGQFLFYTRLERQTHELMLVENFH
jgi:serine/threonine protein kinase